MRFIKNFVFITSTTVLAILIIFLALKNTVARKIIIENLEDALGTKVTIENISISPLGDYVEIHKMSVMNPPGFKEREMAYIPAVYFAWDPVKFIQERSGRIFVLILNIEHVNVIKNKDGLVNIEQLKIVKDMIQENQAQAQKKEKKSSFHLDIFRLTFTDVYYADYHHTTGKDKKPTTHTYAINIKKELFSDLDDSDKIIKLIIYKIFSDTNIGRLISFNIKLISDPVGFAEDAIEQTINSIFFISK